MKKNMKRIFIFALSLMFMLPLLSFKVEASEVSYPGKVFKAPITTEDHIINPKYTNSELLSRKHYIEMHLLEASAEVYIIGLEHTKTGNNPVKYHTYMLYSPAPFKFKERWGETKYLVSDGSSSDAWYDFYERTASKDAGSGLYYYEVSASCALYMNEEIKSKTVLPAYRLTECFYDVGVKEKLLLSISQGTLDNNYDFIEDSDMPTFDPDSAEYTNEIGYLQNVSRDIGLIDPTDKGDYVQDYAFRYHWDKLTNTGFDVTADNVYVSYYHQFSAYCVPAVDIPNGPKRGEVFPIDGKRRLIRRVRGSDMFLDSSQSEINMKCADDVALLDPYLPYAAVWNPHRSDLVWLRIEYQEPSGDWKYGGWYRLKKVDDGFEGSTWQPDGNGDDTRDTDGGYGGGTDVPGNVGTGENPDDALNNADKPIGGTSNDFSVENFPDILKSLGKSVGEIPEFLGELFSFIPPSLISALCAVILLVIIMRILGR